MIILLCFLASALIVGAGCWADQARRDHNDIRRRLGLPQ